jgi:serine/threonine protein kinase
MNNIGTALVYGHDRDCIHRDVKECNIFVNIEKNNITHAVLGDYGLAKYASDVDMELTCEIVTISHRSPEIEMSSYLDSELLFNALKSPEESINSNTTYSGDEELILRYDDRIDTWSYCMVLVFMLTGQSFYDYYDSTKQPSFSSALVNPNIFKLILNYADKYCHPTLKYKEFYLNKILKVGLSEYRNRTQVRFLCQNINEFIKINNIKLNGPTYELEEKLPPVKTNPICIYFHKSTDKFDFLKSFKLTHIQHIDFFQILTRENINNDAIWVATSNLYSHTLTFTNCLNCLQIPINNSMIFAVCYILVQYVLIDKYNQNTFFQTFFQKKSITTLIIVILHHCNYNIIHLFGYIHCSKSKPDLLEPDLLEPDLLEPDLLEPDLLEPDLLEPDLLEPDLLEPDLSKLNING